MLGEILFRLLGVVIISLFTYFIAAFIIALFEIDAGKRDVALDLEKTTVLIFVLVLFLVFPIAVEAALLIFIAGIIRMLEGGGNLINEIKTILVWNIPFLAILYVFICDKYKDYTSKSKKFSWLVILLSFSLNYSLLIMFVTLFMTIIRTILV